MRVCECVEAGVGGDSGWDGVRERGVDEGGVGHEVRTDDALL